MPTRSQSSVPTAAPFVPPRPTLPKLREAAAGCKGCDLWKLGTQTVFGEGAAHARAMFVGEQPGDQEDKAGRPFVGPAGKILDKGLEAAGIDRNDVYVTNAVKHFKWEPRGKRRIHKKPNQLEINACRPWLEAEVSVMKPEVIVCLGATAAQSLLGKTFKVTQRRGEIFSTNLHRTLLRRCILLRFCVRLTRTRVTMRWRSSLADLKVVASVLKRMERKRVA